MLQHNSLCAMPCVMLKHNLQAGSPCHGSAPHAGMDVRVLAEAFDGWRLPALARRRAGRSPRPDGGWGRLAAEKLRREEHVDLVDLPRVQQAAQQAGFRLRPARWSTAAGPIRPTGRRAGPPASGLRRQTPRSRPPAKPLSGGGRRRFAHGHQYRDSRADGTSRLSLASEPCESSTTRIAVRGPGGRAVSRRVVPRGRLPSHHDRVHAAAQLVNHLARAAPEIQRLSPVRVAILPSSVIAHFAMIHGRPVPTSFKYGAFSRRASASSKPTSTVTPAACNSAIPRPRTSENGSRWATTTRRTPDGHGPRAGRRLALVAARFERHVERGRRPPGCPPRRGPRSRRGPAKPPMKTLADGLVPLANHAADHRVRLDPPLAPRRQLQRPPHVPTISLALLHYRKFTNCRRAGKEAGGCGRHTCLIL